MKNYTLALEEEPEYYPALLGLACAAAEQSHVLYGQAEDALVVNKRDLGLRVLRDADRHADLANRSFARCFRMRDDSATSANFALFLYKRATSIRNLPYPASEEIPEEYRGTEQEKRWKAGLQQRHRELDEAIRQFEIVLKDDAGGLGTAEHVRQCKTHHAHRYLGLALFLRSDWDKRDGDSGRQHLMAFLAYVQYVREYVIARWPVREEPDKLRKEREMKRLDVDLGEMRALIRERLKVLTEYEGVLREGRKQPALTAEQRQKRLGAVAVEIEAISALVREFEKVTTPSPAAPKEQGRR